MKITILIISLIYSLNALADERISEEIILKNHQFYPNELNLPAGKKIELIINNQDSTIEEFESFDLKREVIVPSNSSKKIKIGPLKPGQYKFFGEFHESTAQGVLNIKDNN